MQGRQGKALISSPSSLSGSQALRLAPRPWLPSVTSGLPGPESPPEAGAKRRLVSFECFPLLGQTCRFSAWLHTLSKAAVCGLLSVHTWGSS